MIALELHAYHLQASCLLFLFFFAMAIGSEDKCCLVVGAVNNYCCPISDTIKKKVDLAAQKYFFRTGSYELLSKSFISLKRYSVYIESQSIPSSFNDEHTDNVGTAQKESMLSENNAQAVMEYFKRMNQ